MGDIATQLQSWILNTAAGSPGRYSKQDENGIELPFETRDHAILIDRKAQLAFDVRGAHRGNWESCKAFASESTLAGRKWSVVPVGECAFFVPDRTRVDPAVDPELFPKLANRWIWCDDDYAGNDPASPVYAWGVNLYDGLAYVLNRYYGGLALPVSPLASPSGQ